MSQERAPEWEGWEAAKAWARAQEQEMPSWGLESDLVSAAERGDAKKIDRLLDLGASPRWRDELGRDALMAAAESGSVETIERLIERSNRRAKDEQGSTALMLALMHGRHPALARLAQRSDLSQRNKEGKTALMLAVEFDDLQGAKILLEHGAKADQESALPAESKWEEPKATDAIQMAIERNQVSMVKALWEARPISKRSQARAMETALDWRWQTPEMIKALGELGVDWIEWEAQRGSSMSLWGRAACLGQVELIEWWDQQGLPRQGVQQALMEAAINGQVEAMRALMRKGADPSGGESPGEPMVCAVQSGNLEAVDALMENGASMEPPPKRPEALWAAASGLKGRASEKMALALLDRGASDKELMVVAQSSESIRLARLALARNLKWAEDEAASPEWVRRLWSIDGKRSRFAAWAIENGAVESLPSRWGVELINHLSSSRQHERVWRAVERDEKLKKLIFIRAGELLDHQASQRDWAALSRLRKLGASLDQSQGEVLIQALKNQRWDLVEEVMGSQAKRSSNNGFGVIGAAFDGGACEELLERLWDQGYQHQMGMSMTEAAVMRGASATALRWAIQKEGELAKLEDALAIAMERRGSDWEGWEELLSRADLDKITNRGVSALQMALDLPSGAEEITRKVIQERARRESQTLREQSQSGAPARRRHKL